MGIMAMFLIVGNAGFISSAVGTTSLLRPKYILFGHMDPYLEVYG